MWTQENPVPTLVRRTSASHCRELRHDNKRLAELYPLHICWYFKSFRWGVQMVPGDFFFPYLALWTQQGMRTSQEGRLSSFQEDTGYHLGGWPAWSQLDLQPRRNKQVNLKIVSFQKICSNIWQISLITVRVLKMYYTKPNSTNYSEESDSEQRMLLFNTLNEKALKIHLVFTLVSQCNDDVDFPNEFIVVSI